MIAFHRTVLSRKKITIALAAFSVITTGIIAGIFIKNRYLSQDPVKLITSIQQNASLAIGNIHQVSTRDGVKEWILDARSAHVIDETKQLMLEDVTVIYFIKNGEEVRLTASRGVLKTETKDIEVTGQVLLIYSEYTLETEKMNYDHGRRILFSSTPVNIIGNTINISAGSMKYDLTANQTWFQQKVEVLLRENFL
ncbi:MAG: LPS export ABC transporter periplasmic protein LptC [Desulfatirhabdiaceae bacterium]|nr:LPS export ABC transporter periplasmic protein LptC [Desulfatirhabdiaceae bacterium]